MEIVSIKKQKEIYREVYAEHDKLLKRYNICNIHKNEYGKIVCNGQVSDECSPKRNEELCCYDCKNLSNKGCRVKAISCKGWICYKALEKFIATHKKKDIVYFFGMREYLNQQLRWFNIPNYPRVGMIESFKV